VLKLTASYPKIVSFKKKDLLKKKEGLTYKWALYYSQIFTVI
jgi:hypothetical protein